MNQSSVAELIALLGHEQGDWIDLRAIGGRITDDIRHYESTDHDRIAYAATLLNERGFNVYLGINPRPFDGATEDDQITTITCMVIDIDPVRPTGTSATDEQLEQAVNAADKAFAFIAEAGGHPVMAMSGNGAQLWVPITRQPKTQELVNGIAAFEDLVRREVETDLVRVDSIFNPSRIIKMIGTTSKKGEIHRLSAWITRPIRQTSEAFDAHLIALGSSHHPIEEKAAHKSLPVVQDALPICTPIRKLAEQGTGDRSVDIFNIVRFLASQNVPITRIREFVSSHDFGKLTGRDASKFIDECFKKSLASAKSSGKIVPPCSALQRDGMCHHPVVVCDLPGRKKGKLKTMREWLSEFAEMSDPLATGIDPLDSLLRGGMREGQVLYLGAGPGVGKTMLARQIYRIWGKTHSCMWLAIDDSAWGCYVKDLQSVGIDRKDAERPSADTIRIAEEALGSRKLWTLDSGTIQEAIELLVEQSGEKDLCLFIDSAQTVRLPDEFAGLENRAKLTKVAHEVRDFSKKFKLRTIVISELNRDGYALESERSPITWFKESGAIEYCADHAMIMKANDSAGVTCMVCKSRTGSLGNFDLMLDSKRASFGGRIERKPDLSTDFQANAFDGSDL